MKAFRLALLLLFAACETEPETETFEAAAETTAVLAETDLVHIGGTANGSSSSIIVAAAATGTNGRLTSWKTNAPAMAPSYLNQSPILAGTNHQLHVLKPTPAQTGYHIVVSASIVASKLWVRTWSVDPVTGVFTQRDVRTYAPAGVNVQSYALGHRTIAYDSSAKRFQLVTPVIRAGFLRMVTWEINGTTGVITPRKDSGDTVLGIAANSQLTVAFVEGTPKLRAHYAVSALTVGGAIKNTMWTVDDLGTGELRGDFDTGRDIDNTSDVTRNAAALASMPVTRAGFVTVGDVNPSPTSGTGEIQIWESYTTTCGEFTDGCLAPLNITNNMRDTLPAVFGVQQASVPTIGAQRGVARDARYGTELFTKNPDSVQALASVRKVMILLVTLDAIAADGPIDLDDLVTITEDMVDTDSVDMGLVVGEVISLENLLYGMMMDSAGDATWAISKYVAGGLSEMVNLMNEKAEDLGLAKTTYCHDADDDGYSSVGYSTARDQAKLWAAAYANPLFLEFTGKAMWTVCGVINGDTQICHPDPGPMVKTGMDNYLELDGYKGGSGGGSCDAFAGVPPCAGCLSSQATRLDRALVTSGLRSDADSRWPDATKMFDYSYRQIFTPDYRGNSGAQGGTTTDFGLDAVGDLHAVTSVLVGGPTLRVCNWNVDVGIGLLAKTLCTDRVITGLTSGGTPAPPQSVAIVRASALQAEADSIVGRVVAGTLQLSAWRIGKKN
jgi:D-alanyl-D-alanine carboxypeptidase